MVCGGDEDHKNGKQIKGGQRIGVGEGTETVREWGKTLKRKDDMQIRLRGWCNISANNLTNQNILIYSIFLYM